MKQLETKQKDFYETPTVQDIRPVTVSVVSGSQFSGDDDDPEDPYPTNDGNGNGD